MSIVVTFGSGEAILFCPCPAALSGKTENENTCFDKYAYRMPEDGTTENTGYAGEADERIAALHAYPFHPLRLVRGRRFHFTEHSFNRFLRYGS